MEAELSHLVKNLAHLVHAGSSFDREMPLQEWLELDQDHRGSARTYSQRLNNIFWDSTSSFCMRGNNTPASIKTKIAEVTPRV